MKAKRAKPGTVSRSGAFRLQLVARGKRLGKPKGLVKLIFDSRYGELLGGAILGAEATELIAELTLALRLEATYEELLADHLTPIRRCPRL